MTLIHYFTNQHKKKIIITNNGRGHTQTIIKRNMMSSYCLFNKLLFFGSLKKLKLEKFCVLKQFLKKKKKNRL